VSNNKLTVRPAVISDAGAILDIYSHYINNTTVTFEQEVPTADEFRHRMEEIMAEYPFLVCEDGRHIVGYAYAHRHQSRAAYRFSAELSVYLRPHYTNLGIGSAMCRLIIDLLKLQKVQTVYSAVSLPNEPSCAMHEALGFHTAGQWRNTGRKQGRWIDILWYELAIGNYPETPEPLIPFDLLDRSTVTKLFRQIDTQLNSGKKTEN